jgi:hypothetical protein
MTPVDVVMPVRDGGALLEEAVEALRAQTHERWRLLLVDDGSTDGAAERLAAAGDPRIVLLRSTGRGIVAALRTGVEHVRTEHFARMDADDRCDPERLARQLRTAEDGALLALGTAYRVLDAAGEVLGVQAVPTGPDAVRAALRRTNPFCHGSLLLRTDAVRAAGGYREDFPLAEDYDLLLRLAAAGPVDNLPEPLYDWRLDPASSSLRRPREQAQQAARARRAARRAGLVAAPPLRTRIEDAVTPALTRWERLRATPADVVLARRRAGLYRGCGRPEAALREYEAVLRARPLDVVARVRRRRVRAGR